MRFVASRRASSPLDNPGIPRNLARELILILILILIINGANLNLNINLTLTLTRVCPPAFYR